MPESFQKPVSATTIYPTAEVMGCIASAQRLLSQAEGQQLDAAINDALAMIGALFNADRSYVFRFTDPLFISNTHEWCAPGIRALKFELQQQSYGVGEIFWSAFRAHGALLLHDTTTVPVGSDLRTMLMEQDVKSLIAVPVWHGNQIAGFVGMDFCAQQRRFSTSDAEYLQSFAATLGATILIQELSRAKAQTDADLRAANDRLAAMIKALPELLVETNRNGLVTAFHQTSAMTLALSPVEVIGKPPEDFLPANAAVICREAMAQVDRAGWSETFVYSLMIGEQEKHFALHATGKGHDGTAQGKGYIFVVRDVTDSHRQDMHMRQLGRVAELSTNLIFLTDAARSVTWMNPASTRRTGYTLEDAIGKRPSAILGLFSHDPETASRLCAKLDRGEDIHEDLQASSKTGLPYWVSLNVQKLCDSDGAIQGFMVVGTDVTAHKLAETRALRDRTSAMNALNEGLAIIQPDGIFAYLNPALRRILNVPDTTPAEQMSWQDISPDGFNRQLVGMLPQLYAEGVWRGQISYSDPDLTERHFDISISVQDDGSFLFIAHDITARKDAEREQALLREQLQIAQSRQLVSQLASGLAHDVANVLAVISGVIETVRPVQHPDAARALERIESAATQAQALVKNLSQLGRRSATPSVLDLRPLLIQAAELVRPSLSNGAKLDLDLPETPVEVLGESTGIMQVLLNLMLNARDSLCRETGAAGRISVRLQSIDPVARLPETEVGQILPGNAYAMIEVVDTGVGLDEHEKASMFRPYFSTKGQNGVGLGLSIVADILASTMGAIHVESHLGLGTKVQVFWPVPKLEDVTNEAPSDLTALDPVPLRGCHILLVDDDDSELMRMAKMLTAAGAEVASCIDPRDAVAAVRASPDEWDIIVTDQDMGPMSGRQLARSLHHISPNLPIILATGAGALQSASKSAQSEFVSILRKPVTEAVIVAVLLGAVLRRKHTSQAAAHDDKTLVGG